LAGVLEFGSPGGQNCHFIKNGEHIIDILNIIIPSILKRIDYYTSKYFYSKI
jgi:hypothetical protein